MGARLIKEKGFKWIFLGRLLKDQFGSASLESNQKKMALPYSDSPRKILGHLIWSSKSP